MSALARVQQLKTPGAENRWSLAGFSKPNATNRESISFIHLLGEVPGGRSADCCRVCLRPGSSAAARARNRQRTHRGVLTSDHLLGSEDSVMGICVSSITTRTQLKKLRGIFLRLGAFPCTGTRLDSGQRQWTFSCRVDFEIRSPSRRSIPAQSDGPAARRMVRDPLGSEW